MQVPQGLRLGLGLRGLPSRDQDQADAGRGKAPG